MDTLNLKYYQLPISDSFMLALQTPNLVKDIEDLIEHFDTSNYPSKSRVVQSAHSLTEFFFSRSSIVQQGEGQPSLFGKG